MKDAQLCFPEHLLTSSLPISLLGAPPVSSGQGGDSLRALCLSFSPPLLTCSFTPTVCCPRNVISTLSPLMGLHLSRWQWHCPWCGPVRISTSHLLGLQQLMEGGGVARGIRSKGGHWGQKELPQILGSSGFVRMD